MRPTSSTQPAWHVRIPETGSKLTGKNEHRRRGEKQQRQLDNVVHERSGDDSFIEQRHATANEPRITALKQSGVAYRNALFLFSFSFSFLGKKTCGQTAI
jgi:hypothetical protein